MRQDTLVSGTVALSIAAVFNRIVGFAFRAFLVRMVGQEAIGIYQMTYPLYSSVMTIATAGISVGVAKLTADARQRGDNRAVDSTLRTGCYLALITGLAGMLLLMASSGVIAKTLLGEERALWPLLMLAPALPMVSLAGALRGYYQGMRYMYLVATGLVIEQLAHVAASIQLAVRLRNFGVGAVSTGLALGSTIGETIGLVALGIMAMLLAKNRARKAELHFAPLLAMVLPVATGRIILAATTALNTILVPRALRFMGYSASQAAVAYGQLTGMAINVLFIPAVLTFPFASNLLPMMAESATAAPSIKKRSFHQALSFSLILGVPCSIIFVLVGPEICSLLFGVKEAGRLLSTMGWVAWMIYLQHITTAALQGLGRPAIPARNSAISALLSASTMIVLAKIRPELGVTAAVYSIIASISLGALLGLLAVLQEIGGARKALTMIIKGALAGSLAMFVAENVLSFVQLGDLPKLLIVVGVVVTVFTPLSLLMKLHKAAKGG